MLKLPALLLMFNETTSEDNLQLHTLCIVQKLLEKSSKTNSTNIRWIENIIQKIASDKISHNKRNYDTLFEMIESMCVQLTTQMRVDEEIERAMNTVDKIMEQDPTQTLSGADFQAYQQYNNTSRQRQYNNDKRQSSNQYDRYRSAQQQYQRQPYYTSTRYNVPKFSNDNRHNTNKIFSIRPWYSNNPDQQPMCKLPKINADDNNYEVVKFELNMSSTHSGNHQNLTRTHR